MGRTSKVSGPSVTATKAMPKKASKTMQALLGAVMKVGASVFAAPAANTSAEVDSRIDGRAGYEVMVDDNGVALSAYLNWSDLQKNHNKFYVVQALQKRGKASLD